MQIRITVPDEVVELSAMREQAKLRGDFLADWDHYQQTGLHLTSDEVDAWLEQLALDTAAEPPALHK